MPEHILSDHQRAAVLGYKLQFDMCMPVAMTEQAAAAVVLPVLTRHLHHERYLSS